MVNTSKIVCLMWLCLLSCLFNNLVQAQTKEEFQSKPNILFIMVDDLRPELGVYGKVHIKSPHIDRLGATGSLFTRAYTNYPICGPSRASLLSGIYPSQERFTLWNCSQDKDVPGVVSLPMHLRNNNYRTISLGKVYNNLDDGKGSWDEVWRPVVDSPEMIAWEYLTKEGSELFERINTSRQKDPTVRTSDYLPLYGYAYESADVPDDAYIDGKVSVKAIEKLQELKQNPAQPFFLAVGFHKPHSPFNAPKKYWDMYDHDQIQLAENDTPARDVPDILKVDRGGVRGYYGMPKQGAMPDSLARNLLHGYFACISYIDRQVGKILNALEYYGMDKNTIVIFWGDQGHQLGEHGLWDKNQCYQTSSQIPFMVKLPGKNNASIQNQLIENVDVFPTICDLTGLPKPFHLKGKSFASSLGNPTALGKEAVFVRSGLNAETIITKNHAYTEFFDHKKRLTNRVLFDLVADPLENHNVVNHPSQQAIVSELSKKLQEHLRSRDQVYF